MYRKMFSMFSLVLILAVAFSAVSPAYAQPSLKSDKGGSGIYIVEMSNAPVVAYKGDIKGLKATAPKNGQKIDPNGSDVVTYVAYLNAKHDEALAKVGGAKKLYDYNYTFNGFAAELTAAQAAKMATLSGVISVQANETYTLDTSSTPAFLGLSAPGGLWEQLGGVGSAGEGVIIGIVDGGIWPESLSFSDRTGENGNATKDGKLSYQQIPGWHGKCTPGDEFTASDCNQKLIGARYYNAGWGGNDGIDATLPHEYNSPRDFGGHGTHTASTAGGNNGVAITGAASVFGSISGIAPRARIAAYKACWAVPGTSGSCQGVDLVAAIDQAVADGVDVINYSISGSRTNFRDAVEISFLYAADAGVFVAASAGNEGATIGSGSVAHPSPWITTVAAGTHDRYYEAEVKLGDGSSYYGASVNTTGVGPVAFIDSEAAGLPGANADAVRLCYAAVDNGGVAVLDPAKVAGKIVLCDRGVTARVNKSLAVFEAGGVGTIIVNTSPNSLNGDFHVIPTVHLPDTNRAAVKAYAATAGATAQIFPSYFSPVAAPYTAAFSSRGPLRAGNGDLLKPDVIAPGQDVMAAVAPPGNAGESFALYSGTSMSSPHVAGLGALLKDLHPDWSPMMIKSALMTTAGDVLDGPNTSRLVIFRQGAGHVRPNSAGDPGLVFNSGFGDWLGFLCGTQLPTSFCTSAGVPVLDPSNFNTAAIAIGDLAGVQTVTRKVTNVGANAETYTASYTGLAGITVALPGSFTVAKGATQSFNVTFTTAGAALNSYVGGQFTLTGSNGHVVRIPVVVRPVALAAPTQVSGSYNVTFGYNGPFTATASGLVPATTFSGSISTGEFLEYEMTIPAGTTYARVSLFDANVSPASDLDMYLFDSAGVQVGYSGSGTSAEEINLTNPAAGTYYILVEGYGTANPSTFTGFYWTLGSTAAGNMTVTAPANAVIGQTGAINLSFSGLSAETKYLGSIAYGGAAGMPAPTIVRVDP